MVLYLSCVSLFLAEKNDTQGSRKARQAKVPSEHRYAERVSQRYCAASAAGGAGELSQLRQPPVVRPIQATAESAVWRMVYAPAASCRPAPRLAAKPCGSRSHYRADQYE